jgi:hypothetical protein
MTHAFNIGQEVTADNGKTYIVCQQLTADFFKGQEIGYTLRTIRNSKPFGAGHLMAQSRLTAIPATPATNSIAAQVAAFWAECEKIEWEAE